MLNVDAQCSTAVERRTLILLRRQTNATKSPKRCPHFVATIKWLPDNVTGSMHIGHNKPSPSSVSGLIRFGCGVPSTQALPPMWNTLQTKRMLYYAFCRSNLEFAGQVWFPTSKKQKSAIESIQKSFVKFIHPNNSANNVNNDYQLRPYIERCRELDMVSLNRRRINNSIYFIHDLITGRTSSINLRNQLKFFKITRFTRSPEFIKLKICRLECNNNSAFRSACKLYNLAALWVDIFLDRNSFRKAINKLPDSRFIGWGDI